MGWLSSLTNAATEVNDEARSVKLHTELLERMADINQLQGVLVQTLFKDFVARKVEIKNEMSNWSREGCMKVADKLRTEGKQKFDLNMVEGYALLLTSAWLESSQRTSAKARLVFQHLDTIEKRPAVPRQTEGERFVSIRLCCAKVRQDRNLSSGDTMDWETMQRISVDAPHTLELLAEIPGMTERKVKIYGEHIVKICDAS